jgi:hypothetical protein
VERKSEAINQPGAVERVFWQNYDSKTRSISVSKGDSYDGSSALRDEKIWLRVPRFSILELHTSLWCKASFQQSFEKWQLFHFCRHITYLVKSSGVGENTLYFCCFS